MINTPRIFPNTVAGVLEALEITFGKTLYASKVVEKLLRQNKKWGSRDRAFVAEHTYEMVRHWRKLWAMYGKEPQLKRKELEKLFGIYWLSRGFELPDWPKFETIREFDVETAEANLPDDLAIKQSYPEWFAEYASQQLGEDWPAVAEALNTKADVVIRVNTLKASKAEVKKVLLEEGIGSTEMDGFPDALKLMGRPKLNGKASFMAGLYEVHDAGSQTIAPFLRASPTDFVIDACAGAGGKALHLAALKENQGLIIAMDVEGFKLNELEKRSARNGATSITTSLIVNNQSIKSYLDRASRLLLDVPCSGSGVIRRDVDTKWKLQPEHIERNIIIQQDILSRYSQMLISGGTMVYATCSIFKSENEEQVAWFLSENPDFTLEEEKRLNPSKDNDGFYMARLKKN